VHLLPDAKQKNKDAGFGGVPARAKELDFGNQEDHAEEGVNEDVLQNIGGTPDRNGTGGSGNNIGLLDFERIMDKVRVQSS
jgi:hypothetical protein